MTRTTVRSLIKTLFARRRVAYVGASGPPCGDALLFIGTFGPRHDRIALAVTGLDMARHGDRRRLKKALARRLDQAIAAAG